MTTFTPSITSRNAVVFLAVVAAGAALYYMRGILTPLVLAIFLAVMIDSFARVLTVRVPKFPEKLALPTAIVLSLLLFGGSVWIVVENGAGFVGQAKAYAPRLNEVIAKIAGLFGIRVAPTLDDLIAQLNPQQYVGAIAGSLQNFASNAVLVLIYLGFIIASRRGFSRKIVALFPHHAERDRSVQLFQRIRNGVEQYLWIQTVTGLMIAVAAWAVMALVGLDNAFFWAFLIFIAAYIPIIGGAIGCILPPLFALVQFPHSLLPALILAGALQVIFFVVGNVVLPRMQGDSLNMDPTVVLLSLAVWGALWGGIGMFLSTPLTVALMLILAQFDGTRWIAILLSEDGDPTSERATSHGPAGVAKQGLARKKPSSKKGT
ncbi:AI-2E family transporter [Caulobacter endophyticus]|uniref:AI-2E family transporter n=1 Tax=Caulobacter endophyticus TaxID=2172652 RepID=UPI00240EC2AF|nr:AI-2E family transporter [Caulobacter endophyticus]MDG2530411.1 AI-2E family transporter [Caulobacter endophyticus]